MILAANVERRAAHVTPGPQLQYRKVPGRGANPAGRRRRHQQQHQPPAQNPNLLKKASFLIPNPQPPKRCEDVAQALVDAKADVNANLKPNFQPIDSSFYDTTCKSITLCTKFAPIQARNWT